MFLGGLGRLVVVPRRAVSQRNTKHDPHGIGGVVKAAEVIDHISVIEIQGVLAVAGNEIERREHLILCIADVDIQFLEVQSELLQVRADIDEVNAPLVVPGSPAVAYLKGYTDESIPLTFDRIEPYIVPKRSLTGDNRERVDTRVLQVIYRFDKPSFPVYVGQQVDVYIERSDNPMQDQENGTPDLGIQQSKHSPTLLPEGENRGRGTHE